MSSLISHGSARALSAIATVLWLGVASGQDVQRDAPNLSNIWVGTLTSLEDPRWPIENFLCNMCTLTAFERLRELLNDPAQSERSLDQLQAEARALDKKTIEGLLTQGGLAAQAGFDQLEDPVLQCKPVGLIYQIRGALPMKLEQSKDKIVLRYELFNAERTVYMDGRAHPSPLKPSRLGHSIGWWDGPTLVIDSVGFEPNIFLPSTVPGMRTTDQARSIERYTLSDDGQKLQLALTVVDPKLFRRPLELTYLFLSSPGDELQHFECDPPAGSGEAASSDVDQK
ncbi:MAG: hypothetical protein SXG53_05235 [Pseudomonadota bacterium]|nr:hypothetical protein [Pseudomonadota bacterium]